MKAYILSRANGTVQIGKTLYQPCTGAQYKVSSIPRKGEYEAVIEVSENSMQGAREALQKDAEG
jgi:hypothetical protein